MNLKTGSLSAALGVLCALLLCETANAARPGFYTGGSVLQINRNGGGKADFDSFALDVYGAIGYTPVALGNSTLSSSSTSYEFVAGYRFFKHFAAEFEYLDLGKSHYRSVDVVNDGVDTFQVDTRLDKAVSGIGFSALGILPLSERWEAYGRAGVLLASDKTDIAVIDNLGLIFGNANGDSVSLMAGGGISVTFADSYSIRVEFRRIFDAGNKDSPGKGDLDLLSAGFLVQF